MAPQPEEAPPTQAKSTRRVLLLVAAAFVVVQAAFYPLTISVQDESEYLSTAYILRAGTIFADVANVSLLSDVAHAGHRAPFYPPGQGALLVPFTLLGWRSVFVLGIAMHVAGFFLFGRLLGRLGIRREWSALYLLFPPLVLYSRTVMTEVPSATLLLVALLLYLRGARERVAAGVIFGALVFLRSPSLFTFLLVLACAALRDVQAIRSERKYSLTQSWAAPLLSGFAIVYLGFTVYSLAAFGRVGGPPYTSVSPGFGLGYVLPHLGFYAVALLLLYPLMAVAPFLYRGVLRLEIVVVCLGTLLTMSAWYFLDDNSGFAQDLLTGQRLLLPIVPLCLIAYAQMLDRLRLRFRLPMGIATTGVASIGLVAAVVVASTHQGHLREAVATRELIEKNAPDDSLLLVNGETTKFLTPAWSRREFRVFPPEPERPACGPGGSRPTIVYTAQPGAPSSDAALANRIVARLGAVQVLDRTAGWRVVMWEVPACPGDGPPADGPG